MFQLEHELEEWAKRFDRLEVMRSSDIEELEQHVRDSIGVLMTKGLSEEEAFVIATRRVGHANSVGQEFGKVNGGYLWGQRVFWMLAGFVFFDVCQLIISAVAELSQVFTAFAGGNGTAMGYTFVGINAVCWAGLAVWFYRWSSNPNAGNLFGRRLARFHGKLIVLGVVCIVVAAMAARLGGQFAIVMVTSMADLGQATWIAAGANFLFTILIPTVFLFIMLSIRLRIRDTVAAEQ